jgi:hypothetical protein
MIPFDFKFTQQLCIDSAWFFIRQGLNDAVVFLGRCQYRGSLDFTGFSKFSYSDG